MASLNLKTKVKSFFSGLQREKTQDDGGMEEEIHALQPADLPHAREDLRKTEEVIADIEKAYFSGDEDCPKFELEKLGEEVSISSLEDRIFTLKTQDNATLAVNDLWDQIHTHKMVYRQIYGLVSDNYHAYVRELENVTMLEVSLKDASRTCIGARLQLKLAREGVSHGGLGLLAKHRKRERLRALLDILKTLKTLQRTDTRLKELLQEGDFPAATQLCLECQNAIQTYKHYTCVRELAVSLQDLQSEIERELEGALGKMCVHFEQRKYDQIQEAYSILGKTQTAVDTLLMRFTTNIHDSAYAVVADYAKRSNMLMDEESQQQLVKTSYANLCKMINVDDFIPCLKQVCQAMWRLMHTYHQIKLTHERRDRREAEREEEEEADSKFSRNYVKTKLENGLLRVWRDVQQKVRPYLLGIDMSGFKYDDFIRVLDIVNKLIELGAEFCGEGSSSLEESMRQQSLMYFKNYHRARMDELRIFLEVEAWEVCPVRSTFTIHKLREFRFLRTVPISPVDSFNKLASPTRRDDSSVFTRLSADGDPFSHQEEEDEEEVIEFGEQMEEAVSDEEKMEDYDEEGDTARKLKYSDGGSHRYRQRTTSSSASLLLANTTLTVLRFFGNYLQMMNVLRTIGFDVLECLSQLYDYYLYAIHQFFVEDLIEPSDVQLSSKLTTSLKRITDTLILPQQENGMMVQTPDGGIKVPSPSANPVVDLQDSGSLFGLRHRMVAVQSLVFLASQFEYLVTYIEKLIPESKKSFLSQFLFQTVKTSNELCKPVYYGIASKAIPTDTVLSLMGSVKWDIKEIRSQHSSYVDRLLQEFSSFEQRLRIVDKSVRVPTMVSNMLWERAIVMSNRMFVEGFSQAKKCSNEGRALMQLDFQQYRTQIEKISHIRPLPRHSFVEDYIKAYYLSEEDTEAWIRQHKEYSSKQLQVLVTVGVGSRINKRSRQKLLAIIDEAR